MSTVHEIKTIEFHNRKPSKPMIMKAIKAAIKQGHKAIDISWGENCLELVWHDRHLKWYGYGWIKNLGGSDIADAINQDNKFSSKYFMATHFNIVGSAFA